MSDCKTCFYGEVTSSVAPCKGCFTPVGYVNWISIDFLKEDVVKVEGVKYDQDKPQWTLVPFKAFDEVVKVLTIGAKKYAPDNWKKVPNARQRYIDAAFRHMSAYASGEKIDAETGKSHLAHAMCCFLFLLAFDLDSSLEKDNG